MFLESPATKASPGESEPLATGNPLVPQRGFRANGVLHRSTPEEHLLVGRELLAEVE